MKEEAVLFGGEGNLAGVLTIPEAPNGTALILLSAGLIAKSGMGRMHVQMARRAAEAGVTSLRFDFSGVGDSPPRSDHLGVLDIAAQEPSDAMDLLEARGCTRFVLAGLCSGAVAALLAAERDHRVGGVLAMNPPPLTNDQSFDRKGLRQRYLGRSLFSIRAWKNLLSGKVRYDRLLKAAGLSLAGEEAAPGEVIDARGVVEGLAVRRVPMAFLLSEYDKAAVHTRMVIDALPGDAVAGSPLEVTTIAGAAHGLLLQSEKDKLFAITERLVASVAQA